MVKLSFGRYFLRLLDKGDRDELLVLIDANRVRISNYLPKTAKAVHDKKSASAYIKEKIKNAAEMKEFCFLVVDDSAQKLCGAIFLKNFEWSVPKCELGYFIDKAYEGKGITGMALKEITGYCFENLRLNKLFIRAAIDNAGSRKVAEKAGFSEEGLLRKDFMNEKAELIDVVYYGLVKENISFP